MIAREDGRLEGMYLSFIKSSRDSVNEPKYRNSITQLVKDGTRTVAIDYRDLARFDEDLAVGMMEKPDKHLEALHNAVLDFLDVNNANYAYKRRNDLRFMIENSPTRVRLTDLNTGANNCFVTVAGVVEDLGPRQFVLEEGAFRCPNGHLTFIYQDQINIESIDQPLKCEVEGCPEKTNFELDDSHSEFDDFQLASLRWLKEGNPSNLEGKGPRRINLHVRGELVNQLVEGNIAIVSGILRVKRMRPYYHWEYSLDVSSIKDFFEYSVY